MDNQQDEQDAEPQDDDEAQLQLEFIYEEVAKHDSKT